ncbi:hypothetical protein G3435_10595 [Pseudomonas sp. MAFF212428]|uniref:Uncharacterized protein n=1 Tax=Pseudomonas brassicae TaxID=2708063 RepID=A0A6B3P288_9PSED|nr:hypothetical protein [Pseudomonas brassicae]NER60316.1 hypothetical protein [Pseudomonas brassicae]NER65844.1 hypothetical protein [Pseudomonas brassicae]
MSRFIAVSHAWNLKGSLGFQVYQLTPQQAAEAQLQADATITSTGDSPGQWNKVFTLVELDDHEYYARPLTWRERLTGTFKGRS